MTREQKIEAFEMRLDGATLQEIGDKFGVSAQTISYTFNCANKARKKNHVYPNLESWIAENNLSQKVFAEILGISHVTLSVYLTGRRPPSFYFINAVAKETGMTFEEAFSKGDTNA